MTARDLARTAYRIGTRPVGSIQRLSPTPGQFVLTYDDGPDPRHTPGILAVLDELGATATFFVLMSKVRRNPQLLREVHAAGHEIALHGLDHQRLTTFTSKEVQQRTVAGKSELEDALGSAVTWMRPPYGAQQFSTWRAIRKAGVEPVLWSGTFWDWKDMAHEQRVEKALSSARPGALLLAHDSFPDATDGVPAAVEPQVERARLAHDVLSRYADRGLQARSLRDALSAGKSEKWAWFSK